MDKTAKIFKDVRFIKDREKANAQNTNRPHEDILFNLELTSATIDNLLGNCLGAWNDTDSYKKGDVVSYGLSFYVSLQDNNWSNKPKPTPYSDVDRFWYRLTSVKAQKHLSKVRVDAGNTGIVVGAVQSNGRYFTEARTQAKKIYSLLRASGSTPFSGEYHLKLLYDHTDTDRFSKEAYLVLEVKHRGFSHNTSGQSVPVVNIKDCYTNACKADLDYDNYAQPMYWDRFGPYGITIQSVINGDGSVGINLSTKWDAEIQITGAYDIEPLFTLLTGNPVARYVNHLVRPNGGDLAQNIGSLVAFDNSLTRRQVWDRGLLSRGQDIIVGADVFSLLFLSKGVFCNAHLENSVFPTPWRPADIHFYQGPDRDSATILLKSISDRVLRNSGALAGGVGTTQEDATRRIYGGWDGETLNDGTTLALGWRNNAPHTQVYHGAFKRGRVAVPNDLYVNSTPLESYGWQMDSSLIVPTASENRVKSLIVQYYTQAF